MEKVIRFVITLSLTGLLFTFVGCGGSEEASTDEASSQASESKDTQVNWKEDQPGVGIVNGKKVKYIYGKGANESEALTKACLLTAKSVAIDMKDVVWTQAMPDVDKQKYMVQEYYEGTKHGWVKISKALLQAFKNQFKVVNQAKDGGSLLIQASMSYTAYEQLQEEQYGNVPHITDEQQESLDGLDEYIGDAEPE